MKRIAWGTSKLLWLQLTYGRPVDWEYVIDDFTDQVTFFGLPVKRSAALAAELPGSFEITIFAVSSSSIASILHRLAGLGFSYGNQLRLYSDLSASEFHEAVKVQLGWEPDRSLFTFATAFTLNARTPLHTTICGTWLVLESIRRFEDRPGDVAEVGAYECGNAICMLQSPVWQPGRPYYIFDSFEGFPDLSPHDPRTFAAGDYATSKSVQEVVGYLAPYREAHVIKGYVPQTFEQIPGDACFSTVFYDCDLYQPALDTFRFFWDRLVPGGLILVHDYFAQPGGFEGVKKATDEFCVEKNIVAAKFWQNTMAVIRKP
jgi:hypothetical protein